MSWRDTQRKNEQDILQRVRITPEELFWLRIDAAKAYLRHQRGEAEAKAYEASPVFWNWWLQVWSAIDQDILSKLSDGFEMDFDLYARFFEPAYVRFYPNNDVVRSIRQIQTEEVPHA